MTDTVHTLFLTDENGDMCTRAYTTADEVRIMLGEDVVFKRVVAPGLLSFTRWDGYEGDGVLNWEISGLSQKSVFVLSWTEELRCAYGPVRMCWCGRSKDEAIGFVTETEPYTDMSEWDDEDRIPDEDVDPAAVMAALRTKSRYDTKYWTWELDEVSP
jgi:hypothetical protein